jgi:hypothetical protein
MSMCAHTHTHTHTHTHVPLRLRTFEFLINVVPVQDYYRPLGLLEHEAPSFRDNWHIKVVRLSPYEPAAFTPKEIFLVLTSVRG